MMLLVAGTLFMEILDGTILATAAPHMAAHLHVQPQQVAVAITAYLITMAVLIPLSGWLADRFGARTIYLGGIAVFTGASALCASSGTLAELTALRVLQGAGGALMVPVGRMIVLRATDKRDLVRAVAYLTWPALAAPIAAPLAGGLLTTYLSWRWIFLINVPIGAVALIAAVRLVPQVHGETRDALDWPGFLLTAVCLGALVVAAAALGSPKVDVALVAFAAAASLAAGAAAARHLLAAPEPLLDLRLFRIPTFRCAHTAGAINRLTIQAVPFLLPLLFQVGFGWSPVRAGAVVIALFAGNLGIKPLTTPLLRRFGFRRVIFASGALSAATMLACAAFAARTPLALIVVVLFVSGAARSSGFTAYTTITFADVDAASMRHANTITSTATQLGIGVGVALGAVALRIGDWTAPWFGRSAATSAYSVAFVLLAALTLLGALRALRMRGDAGAQLLGGEPDALPGSA